MKTTWLLFVAMSVLCWGAYVPTIHSGQTAIKQSGSSSPQLWAFLLVGAAYFLVAVLAPLGLLGARGDLAPVPSSGAMGVALFAGVLGAIGALGVILALMNGGTPQTVPPLVFSGAPVVATIVAMMMHPPKEAPSPMYYAGILLAAAGAGLVLYFKPK